jgi:1-phosphofructokinase
MVVTVTLNPALDYVTRVDEFRIGTVNRTVDEAVYPGGKGVNVSLVLSQLGIPNLATGFIAGFTGQELSAKLRDSGCAADFVQCRRGMTRINVKIRSAQETELNGMGPVVSAQELALLFQKLEKLTDEDILVLAGSIPGSLPSSLYEQILERVPKQVRTVVDTAGDSLKKVLPYHPFLVKPNHHELGELFGVLIDTKEKALQYATRVQAMGARNVLVSMAGEGAVMVCENGENYNRKPPSGMLVNSVGAGDSLVAGFLAGYQTTGDFRKAFELGVITGSVSAYSEWLAKKEQILPYLNCPEEYGL